MKYRSFIAFEIPPDVQIEITETISPLIARYPKPLIRWVKTENIHITLRFLSDRTFDELQFIANSIKEEVKTLGAFSFNFSQLGIFPNSLKPRIIWIGVDATIDMSLLHNRIENICNRIGLEKERRSFTPHITLGRINNRYNEINRKKFFEDMTTISVNSIGQVINNEITIFKSELKPSGPVYTVFQKIPFGL